MPSDAENLSQARRCQEQAIGFLRDLVRIPSVNGEHAEAPVAERILQEAQQLGLAARLLGRDTERPNVIVETGQGQRGFAFIGHMDTVATGDPADWEYAPFEATLADGRLIGRGAADNKAGIACGLYALALLRDQGELEALHGRALLAGVVDEESGACSPLGVRYLLDEGALRAEAAIYTYASDVICVGHRGLLRVQIDAHGRAIHSGSREWDHGESGVNAVAGLAQAILELEQLAPQAAGDGAFQGLHTKITPGTVMRGGDWEGMVPARAQAIVDVRLLPGLEPEAALAQIDELLQHVVASRPGLRLERTVRACLPAASIPLDHPLVRAAQRATTVFTGETWAARAAGPANEGYMLIQAGVPTLCGFGPSGGNAHAPNEWIRLASIPTTIAMYARIARDILSEEA